MLGSSLREFKIEIGLTLPKYKTPSPLSVKNEPRRCHFDFDWAVLVTTIVTFTAHLSAAIRIDMPTLILGLGLYMPCSYNHIWINQLVVIRF